MPTLKEIRIIKQEVRDPHCRLPAIFNAVGDHNRCALFKAIIRHDNLCVSDMAKILNISIPAASQHLKLMDEAHLLIKKRRGAGIYYKANNSDPVVAAVVEIIKRELKLNY